MSSEEQFNLKVGDGDHLDKSLRPSLWSEYIGQDSIKDNLKILLDAAKRRKHPPEHLLFYGPPGLGKTTLSYLIAKELNCQIKSTSGPAIDKVSDLASILTNLEPGDILFIDEIHRLGRAVEEILYPAMEDYRLDFVIGKGPSARSVRLKLPKFTIVGATTRLALVSAPLRARFGAVYRLDYYSQDAMEKILLAAADKLEVPADFKGIVEIALRARGTPRVALRLLRRVRDYAQVRGDGMITTEISQQALELLSIDEKGLDTMDRRVLQAIAVKYNGGPVGIKTIAASIREDPDTIMDVVEPYLMQLGFMQRTSQGRVATRQAYLHLGLEPPAESNQPRLLN